jgi:hypothetical protein
MKYVKKPIVIEAFQFGVDDVPIWFLDHVGVFDSQYNFIKINTPEGERSVEYGDMIIKGIKAEIYPCKKAIFDDSYEVYEGNEQ